MHKLLDDVSPRSRVLLAKFSAGLSGQTLFGLLGGCALCTNGTVVAGQVYRKPNRLRSSGALSAFLVSQILIEIPWNTLGSSLLFFCWYWASGFDSSRAAFSFLLYFVTFPLYYTTLGHSIAAISYNGTIASTSCTVLFSFIVILMAVSIVLMDGRGGTNAFSIRVVVVDIPRLLTLAKTK